MASYIAPPTEVDEDTIVSTGGVLSVARAPTIFKGRTPDIGSAPSSSVAALSTRYISVVVAGALNAVEAAVQSTMGKAGTLVAFRVKATGPLADGALTVVFRINGADVAATSLSWATLEATSWKTVEGLSTAIAAGAAINARAANSDTTTAAVLFEVEAVIQ